LLGTFNGVTIPSFEFRFFDLMGGGGDTAAAFVNVEAAGAGLVPRRFGELRSSERGGIGRPLVVLGLWGLAGSSTSVRGGGRVELFCVWRGVEAGGGANWDCACACWGVGLRGGASRNDVEGVGACCVIVGFGREGSCVYEVGWELEVFVPATTPELAGSLWSTIVSEAWGGGSVDGL
jgi:hypothetical protein